MPPTKQISHRLITLLLIIVLIPSCALQLISDYDQRSLDQMELIAKKVDRLYLQLEYMAANKRDYHRVAASYLDIDVELQALKTRQQLRAINELALTQVEIAISLWKKGRQRHQQINTVTDFFIKRYRKQYNRLYLAMIKGEESKKQPTNQKGPKQ